MSEEHRDLSGSTGPSWGVRESGALLKSFDATGAFLLVFEMPNAEGEGVVVAEIGLRDRGRFDLVHDREGARIFAYPVFGIEGFMRAGPLRALRMQGDDVEIAGSEALDLFQGFRETFQQVDAICERLVEIHRRALAQAVVELRRLADGATRPGGPEDDAATDGRLQQWADQIAAERLPPGLRGDHALMTLSGRSVVERASALLRILETFVEADRPKERNGPRP